MDYIYKLRGEGKTTELIKIANNKPYVIVCFSRDSVIHTINLARFMKCNIQKPITYDEFNDNRRRKYFQNDVQFLLDDIDVFLMSKLRGMHYNSVKNISFSGKLPYCLFKEKKND